MVLARTSALLGPLMMSAALKKICARSATGLRSHSLRAATEAWMALFISSWRNQTHQTTKKEPKYRLKEVVALILWVHRVPYQQSRIWRLCESGWRALKKKTNTMYLNIWMDRKLFNITWNMDYCITACRRLFGGFCLCLLLCIIQVLINTWMMKSHKTMKDELTDSWYLISLVQTSSFPTTHGISSVLPFSSCNACRTQQTE